MGPGVFDDEGAGVVEEQHSVLFANAVGGPPGEGAAGLDVACF